MTPAERVRLAFPRDDDAFAETYLQTILARWCEVQAAARRSGLLLLVLVALFLLLTSSNQDAELALGPFKLKEAARILVWLPMLASFVGFETFSLRLGYWQYENLVRAVVERRHPMVVAASLERMLAPSAALVGAGPHWEELRSIAPDELTDRRRSLSAILSVLVDFAWVVLVLAAYVWLILERDVQIVAFTISVAVAAFNVVRIYMLAIDALRAGMFAAATSAPRA
jgi:hypothetical protein